MFSIRSIEFMIDFYPVSKLRDSGRHKMINVEGYSAVSDGFVADESLIPDHIPDYSIRGETHTWLSERLMSRPSEVNAAFKF